MKTVRWKRTFKRGLGYAGIGLLAGLLLFELYVMARLYLFASCHIPTGSMTPALVGGDYIIVSLRIPGRRVWQADEGGRYTIERKPGVREVRVGDVVHKGDVLCIIEAMKLMNEVVAEKDGVIEAVCAENGQVVEYGTELFRIKELSA